MCTQLTLDNLDQIKWLPETCAYKRLNAGLSLPSWHHLVTKDKNYQPNEHQIKCSSGAVFDASDEPLLCELLTDYYAQRKDAQKVFKKAEKEADELKQILSKRLSIAEKGLR